MKQNYDEYYIEKILIKGRVHYKDNQPAKGAIVILEKIICGYNADLQEEQNKCTYFDHTLTNCNGEFNFFVSDRTSYYKIKVFDNNHC